MPYWESPEHARVIRDRVLALMDAHVIASTPMNYDLWFAYELGQNRDLRDDLDDALETGQFRDAATVKALHERYCSRPDERLENANSRIQTELTQLASALATVGEGAAAYGRVLGQAGDQLTRSIVPVDVKVIIDEAAGATTQMEQRNRVLEQQVESSSRELATLRSQLEAVKKESLTDSLTGLPNRRAFDDRMAGVVSHANETREPLCLLMCDIDRFKTFNDTWGHATGDQVLRLVASVLKSNVKAEHLTARYGGEEMSVVLPHTSLADAIMVAERIRTAIEAKKVVKKSTGESLGQITISIGVAQFIADESIDVFVARADRNLYMAKQTGRNRVCWVGKSVGGIAKVSVDAVGVEACNVHRESGLVELEFADRDTPLIVDASVTSTDERLVQVLGWWRSTSPGGALPQWRDAMLSQIGNVRDLVHIYEVSDQGADVLVRFVGPALVAALGEDPTGVRYSMDSPLSDTLRPTAERLFELVSLTRQMRAPLRAFSKSVRHLRGQRLSSEILLLPFSENGVEASTILCVTIFTPLVSGVEDAVA